MPTIQQLEQALIKADAAGDTKAAREIAAEIKRRRVTDTKKQPAKPRQRGTGIGPIDTTLDVINEALLGTAEGAYNLGAMVTDPIARLFTSKEQMAAARQQRKNVFAEARRNLTTQDRPIAREIGGVLAPGGAVSRVATLTAPVVRQLPRVGPTAERIVQAAGTGGIGSGRTAAQTVATPGVQRAGQLAERVTGGATGAAATAALADQPVLESAAFGAGLPIVGSVVRRVGGFAGDITKLPRQKAAEIIRKSLGENLDEARAAFAQMSPDDRRLAEQVLVEAGIEPDTFYGLGRIAQDQLQPPGVNPMRVTLEQQAAAREARLAEAAGGATMEEVRAAARGGRQAVSREMGPLREEAFERASLAGRIVPEAEDIARQATQRADEITASGIVPRMRGLEERAAEQAEIMGDMPAIFPSMEGIQQTRGIAGAAGQRADQAIEAQIGLRDVARDMDALVNDLAAEGLRPMRAAPLVQALRQRLAKPDVKVDDLQSRTLKGLLRKINDATDKNGMLDARALGQIRKTGINDLVEGWMGRVSRGAAPSSGNLQRTSSLSLELRDLIDNTLRESGAGDVWPEYLARSARGYAAVNRGELAGEALRLYKQDPANAKAFQDLVRGDMPKTVGKIMGGGPEAESFAGAFVDDPARLGALRGSAREMEMLNRMQELRTAGAGPAGVLLREAKPGLLGRATAAATLSTMPSLRIGAVGAEETVKNIMSPRVQREIAGAYTSGPAMRDIINTFPAHARISEQISRLPASVRNVFAQALVRRGVAPPPEPVGYDAYGEPLYLPENY
jgi:hypothetical protein